MGQNPPYGASINYYLKSAPSGNVTVTISDAKGQVVRSLTAPRTPGLNRVYWNLRDNPSKGVVLRTAPLYAPHVRLSADGTREGGGGRMTILQPPGSYTVKLSVGGRDYTQPLIVRKDPHSAGTEADIDAQHRMLLDVRRDLDAAVDAVNSAEMVRSQVYNLLKIVDDTELKQAADELDKKITAVEGNLVELRNTGRGQDGVRWGSKLVQKINYVGNGLASGDFKPTSQQLTVHKELQDRLRTWQGQLGDVLNKDLGLFNEMLKRRNLPGVITQIPTRRGSDK